MKPSLLQLDQYFFVKLHLEANAKADPAAANNIETKVDVSQGKEDSRAYLVSLAVHLQPEEGTIPPYSGEIVVLGYFRVHASCPEDRCDSLVAVNGASLLYAAVREMVANFTARGPWPMVTLVAANFGAVPFERVPPDQDTGAADESKPSRRKKESATSTKRSSRST